MTLPALTQTKVPLERYSKLIRAAVELSGASIDADHLSPQDTALKGLQWLVGDVLRQTVQNAYNGTAPQLKGLPPVHAFLGWRGGDGDPDLRRPTRAWTKQFKPALAKALTASAPGELVAAAD